MYGGETLRAKKNPLQSLGNAGIMFYLVCSHWKFSGIAVITDEPGISLLLKMQTKTTPT